ncbi:uncharacterized protein LOC133887434 isoform X2 [Phragmites australis]|uniref:uncharacterized protein LOC133887434 isoform X2 n=1 Tax=Phragmites australis TaxID=29695 RepID=UPI002D7A3C10|nr:uncharacterized protein LOC133887434 isoform X2 [Phragmites australis]
MAAGRSPATSGRPRRRGWSKSPKRPPRPSSPPPASSPSQEPTPLPPGAEVEVRVDDDGFHGSWFEAKVVDFAPARGPRYPARYTVTYSHLLADDGGGTLAELFAPTHIRPRPPPAEDSSSPPRFLLHDIVEAFHNDGWWSGIVVAAPNDPAASVTVAFPITREVITFPPHFARPRRDYVYGEWVPSRSVIAVQPKHAVRVYEVGEKVEVGRDREVYGYSWFPATVAKVVDPLSYVVEYFDLEEEGESGAEKATEYLHWRFIRPAVEHSPRESEFRLGPSAAVEAYCDGAWSPGVVRRVVGEGEYEVTIDGKMAELLVTKVVELLKPQYKWNGKQWRIVSAKRQANLRRRSISGKSPSSPVDVAFSDDEHSHDPESSATKRSRKKLQQLEVILTDGSEHSSVSEMDTHLSSLCKSPASNHSPNSCSPLSAKNSLQVLSHRKVSSAPTNVLLCASSGHSTPQNESMPNGTGETVHNQEIMSEMMLFNGQLSTPVCGTSADDAYDMLSIAELRKKMASARINSASQPTQKKLLSVKTLKVKKDISKSKRSKTHPIQELQGKNDASDNSKGNINFSSTDIVCALTASVEGQTTSVLNRQVSKRTNSGSNSKVLTHRKLSKRIGSKKLCSPCSSLDATSTVHQRRRKKVAGLMKESSSTLESTKSDTQQLLDVTLEDTLNINGLANHVLLSIVPPRFESMHNKNGIDIHVSMLEEEPTPAINICQANINPDLFTEHAATQVAKSNHLMETAILSLDCPVQQAGEEVDERSILLRSGSTQCTMDMDNSPLRSCSVAGSSMPSQFSLSQISGHQALFVKNTPAWPLIEAMDVFKEVPQQPHFLPLREYSPALREGMALGLMVSFANLVKSTRESSIDDSMELFEDKISTLRHLEANGFNVQFLQSSLTKLLQIKSSCSNYLGEIDKLKAQMEGTTTSLSKIDALLFEKDRAVAELEQKLGHLRQESQQIAKDKEHEDAELLKLKSAHSRLEEAYGDAERQFQSVLAGLHRKQLT